MHFDGIRGLGVCSARRPSGRPAAAMSTSTSVTHPDGTVVHVTTTATTAPPKSLKLMYFDGRGLMELPRQLLATAGLFAKDGDFEDFRYPIAMEDGKFVTTEFSEAQAAGEHGSWNMSRVPLAIADGVEIGQGKAIARFVAKSYGLMGATPGQEGQIDTLCEHVAEMADAFKKLSTDEEKAKWFTTPAEPPAADKSNRQLLWYHLLLAGPLSLSLSLFISVFVDLCVLLNGTKLRG